MNEPKLTLQLSNSPIMRYLLPFLILLITSCQGRLTEEQKKEMKEGMKANEIMKIPEAEIIEGAFQYGRTISDILNVINPDLSDLQQIHQLQEEYHVKIYSLESGDSLLMEIEQQLIEAYTNASGVELTDNIQKIGNDSLLYTKPIMETEPDGALQFKYALGIKIPKKDVILSMQKK